jgi:hypothetical protein
MEELRGKVAVLEHQMQTHMAALKRHEHILTGNGEEGLTQKIALLTERLSELVKALEHFKLNTTQSLQLMQNVAQGRPSKGTAIAFTVMGSVISGLVIYLVTHA